MHYRGPVSNVLVVDDTPSIRLLIRTNLELAGHRVIEATDGRECLELIDSADPPPDVVTMDIMMPRLDGLATVEQLRTDARWRDLGIVMITTQGRQHDIARAAQAGVDAYLIKPFDPGTLVETIERVITDRRRPPAGSSVR